MIVNKDYGRALRAAGLSGDLAIRIAALPEEWEFHDPERLPGIIGSLARHRHCV